MNLRAVSRDYTGVLPRREPIEDTGPPVDDRELVRRVARGDERAFGQLYHAHSLSLYNYVLRLVHDPAVAENLLQEVFVAVWQGASGFRGGAQARTWFFRIAHHQAVSWLRRERSEISLDEADFAVERGAERGADRVAERDTLDGASGSVIGSSDVESAAWSAWRADQIRAVLDRLAPNHRAVIELVFFHELSYAEVAEVLDCPVGTVKSRMSWARRHLADALKNLNHDSHDA